MNLSGRGVAVEKAMNEVRYWLDENNKQLMEDDIESVALEVLELFVENDYSSLEAATENVMENYDFPEDM